MRSGMLGLSSIDKREIWSRWKAGQTLHEIGRVSANTLHMAKHLLQLDNGETLRGLAGRERGTLNGC